MTFTSTSFSFNSFDKVGGIDLTMRMWIGDAHRFAFVLEDQNMLNLWTSCQIFVLLLPNLDQVNNFGWCKFTQRQVVLWAITNNSGDSVRGAVAKNARRCRQFNRCFRRNARMIVIENKGLPLLRVDHPADTRVASPHIEVFDVFGQLFTFIFDRTPAPGAVLAMGSNDHPFFAQGMPTFFPNHL